MYKILKPILFEKEWNYLLFLMQERNISWKKNHLNLNKKFDSIKEKIESHDEFKYLDEPYMRFKDDEQEQETFFIKDPSGNVIEIKTMRTPELLWADNS